MKEGHTPKFFRPRPLPVKTKELVTKELHRLITEGTYKLVETSEYGTPIVPIIKGDKVRICGAYNVTINCNDKF